MNLVVHRLRNPLVILLLVAPVASGATIELNSLTRAGTAQIVSPGVLRLTPNFDTSTNSSGEPIGDPPAGAAWAATPFQVSSSFSVGFKFRMSDPTGYLDADGSGGDGIAFVIQNDPRGTGAIGRGAGGIGFLGIYNSVAVMFDTYTNNYAYGDPNGNYVAVNTRGQDFNVPHHFCTDGQLTTDPSRPLDLPGVTCTSNPTVAMTGLVSPLLDDGNIHEALISYTPGTLAVYLDAKLLLTAPLDLTSTLSLLNGTNAFLGFTAGTRFSYQNQDILEFTVTPIPEPSTAALCLGAAGMLLLLKYRKRA
jgi:hypothetical protein